jgi:hypothetical protein
MQVEEYWSMQGRILESAGKIIAGDEKTTFFALVIAGFARNHHFHLRS